MVDVCGKNEFDIPKFSCMKSFELAHQNSNRKALINLLILLLLISVQARLCSVAKIIRSSYPSKHITEENWGELITFVWTGVSVSVYFNQDFYLRIATNYKKSEIFEQFCDITNLHSISSVY